MPFEVPRGLGLGLGLGRTLREAVMLALDVR
jgi:hypothetical protein